VHAKRLKSREPFLCAWVDNNQIEQVMIIKSRSHPQFIDVRKNTELSSKARERLLAIISPPYKPNVKQSLPAQEADPPVELPPITFDDCEILPFATDQPDDAFWSPDFPPMSSPELA
jgi:hypothetical protein